MALAVATSFSALKRWTSTVSPGAKPAAASPPSMPLRAVVRHLSRSTLEQRLSEELCALPVCRDRDRRVTGFRNSRRRQKCPLISGSASVACEIWKDRQQKLKQTGANAPNYVVVDERVADDPGAIGVSSRFNTVHLIISIECPSKPLSRRACPIFSNWPLSVSRASNVGYNLLIGNEKRLGLSQNPWNVEARKPNYAVRS